MTQQADTPKILTPGQVANLRVVVHFPLPVSDVRELCDSHEALRADRNSWKATAEELDDKNVNKALAQRHEMQEQALQKRLAESQKEVERLRLRTHQIAEAADARLAPMVKAVAKWKRDVEIATKIIGRLEGHEQTGYLGHSWACRAVAAGYKQQRDEAITQLAEAREQLADEQQKWSDTCTGWAVAIAALEDDVRALAESLQSHNHWHLAVTCDDAGLGPCDLCDGVHKILARPGVERVLAAKGAGDGHS